MREWSYPLYIVANLVLAATVESIALGFGHSRTASRSLGTGFFSADSERLRSHFRFCSQRYFSLRSPNSIPVQLLFFSSLRWSSLFWPRAHFSTRDCNPRLPPDS